MAVNRFLELIGSFYAVSYTHLDVYKRQESASVEIATLLGALPDEIMLVRYGALLHDLGKIAIPVEIPVSYTHLRSGKLPDAAL